MKQRRRGFTFPELLATLGILSVLYFTFSEKFDGVEDERALKYSIESSMKNITFAINEASTRSSGSQRFAGFGAVSLANYLPEEMKVHDTSGQSLTGPADGIVTSNAIEYVKSIGMDGLIRFYIYEDTLIGATDINNTGDSVKIFVDLWYAMEKGLITKEEMAKAEYLIEKMAEKLSSSDILVHKDVRSNAILANGPTRLTTSTDKFYDGYVMIRHFIPF